MSEPADGNDAAPQPKKKTRRGSRGGRNRKRKTATPAAATDGTEPQPAHTDSANEEDWGYVPMSEWADELSE